jgi:uncharacterized membrane protein YhaH (DUF805 family)
MNWYLQPWRKYAVFSGRARRKEYWIFTFVNMIIWMILYAVLIAFMGFSMDSWSGSWGIGSILIFLFYILTLIPTYAVMVRRLHDTGRSGWWFFINFVPLIGSLILLIILLSDSQAGNNQYGPNPKFFGGAPGGYAPQYPPQYAQPPYPPAGYPYPPQSQAGAFCPRCGAPRPPGATFCQNCGTRM